MLNREDNKLTYTPENLQLELRKQAPATSQKVSYYHTMDFSPLKFYPVNGHGSSNSTDLHTISGCMYSMLVLVKQDCSIVLIEKIFKTFLC